MIDDVRTVDGVVITGMGALSALGRGVASLARALENPAPDGIGTIERFDTTGFTTNLGAIVPCDDHERSAETFARIASKEAVAHALEGIDPRRIALVLGSSLGSGRDWLYEIADELARDLGIRGPCFTISTACSSSSTAIGCARDLLLAGFADVAIAGGADILAPELFAGFHALGALSTSPCAPFSTPFGLTMGEGAAFVILERERDARRKPLAWVLGYGLSADAYHPTTPDPTGSGIARAIRGALADADVDPKDIGYVNAHGTGTEANDPAEARGIANALGRLDLPVSSSKSFLGHAQGAAGALELVMTVLALQAQRLPPTLHTTTLRRSAPTDVVPEPRAHAFDVALSLNAAFAGSNSAILVSRSPRKTPARSSVRPRIRSAAVLAGSIEELADLDRAIRDGSKIEPRIAHAPLERLLPMADTRGFDPSTRFLSTVVAKALGGPVRGEARDRTGIVACVSTYPAATAKEFRDSIEARGILKLNATLFSRMVLNAPTGVAATLLSLRGTTTTLTAGYGGGAIAVAYAAALLSHPGYTDSLMVGAVDEAGDAEGAAALVLGREGEVELAGWAMRGPNDPDVVKDALASAKMSVDVMITDDIEPAPGVTRVGFGPMKSAGSLLACAHAFSLVRSRAVRSALVMTKGGGASVALVFSGANG